MSSLYELLRHCRTNANSRRESLERAQRRRREGLSEKEIIRRRCDYTHSRAQVVAQFERSWDRSIESYKRTCSRWTTWADELEEILVLRALAAETEAEAVKA